LNFSARYLLGVGGPNEVVFCASDIGWVLGHSYIIYAPLLAGATTLIFEGKPIGTPDAGTFWRIASEYKVKILAPLRLPFEQFAPETRRMPSSIQLDKKAY
jgi:propionyl-CoA synthetase